MISRNSYEDVFSTEIPSYQLHYSTILHVMLVVNTATQIQICLYWHLLFSRYSYPIVINPFQNSKYSTLTKEHDVLLQVLNTVTQI